MVRNFNALDNGVPHNACQTPDGVFFTESPRARRKRDIARLKARMMRFANSICHTKHILTPREIGRLASIHGLPTSGKFLFTNKRANNGPTIGERRANEDGLHTSKVELEIEDRNNLTS